VERDLDRPERERLVCRGVSSARAEAADGSVLITSSALSWRCSVRSSRHYLDWRHNVRIQNEGGYGCGIVFGCRKPFLCKEKF